ncbi:MAG: aldehyde dehydrogenase family protein [Candidatus Kapabacteria bacterium]|nr:aldehyde dehydrogenase family protein [Candidatus Kapabacteria bacterium]
MSSPVYQSLNPYTEEIFQQYSVTSPIEIHGFLQTLSHSQQQWSTVLLDEKQSLLGNLKTALLEKKETLAELISLEMGKPLNQSRAEIEKCTTLCEYYTTIQPSVFEEEHTIDDTKTIISYKPIGVILLIMPWNFPLWQVLRCAIPALLMGNTILLKHAPNVPRCSLFIEKLFTEVISKSSIDLPIFKSCFVSNETVAELISSPIIQGVSLTGSTNAGKIVASLCGKAVKKCVLELGGSDAYILLEDAELTRAIDACVTSRLLNTGQSCISAKRFIVHKRLVSAFIEGMKSAFEKKTYGDPMKSFDLGTIARKDLRDGLHSQVQRAITSGAECILGGFIPVEKGFFYPPTILTNVSPSTSSFDEELFGPVAQIIEVENDKHALELANNSSFGLGGAIFSRDEEYAQNLALNYFHTGSIAINDFLRSDARLPFGGIKESGFGREMGIQGLREFSNCKTIRFA